LAARTKSLDRGTVRVRWLGLVPCLLLALLLGGCISERQEQQIGDEMAGEINAQLPLIRDPLLNVYLSRLGENLAEVSGRSGLEYRFYLVDSEMVNAFALPGGHIYITRGLIERTRSGAELAGVLAHEIGHVAERHGVEKLQRHLRTGSLVSTLYTLILGGEPSLLRQNPTRLAGILWSAQHSREDEQEADRLAVKYLIRAGFDPEAIISLLETLVEEERQQAASPAAAWFSTHPMTTERIVETQKEIEEEVAESPRAEPRRLTSYPAFLRRIAALPPPPDATGFHP
jgi:predicted Zn-dependent protease